MTPPLNTETEYDLMDILVIALLLCLIVFIFWHSLLSLPSTSRAQNLPPGPAPLPIIGNINKLGKQPHVSLANLARIYGPIMHLKLGRLTTVVVSSSYTAQQVLQKQDLVFSSRSIPHAIRACNHFKYSVAWLPVGTRWRSLRRIMTTKLFTANRLDANQGLRSKKVQELMDYCRRCGQTGEPVDIGRAAFRTSLNLLSNTIFSKDMTDPYEDSGKDFKDLIWNIMLQTGKPNLVDFFPFLDKIDPQGINRRLTLHLGKLIKLFDDMINERLGNSAENNNDILDELIKISQKSANEIDKAHMQHLFTDLFAAGTDTSSSLVEWGMTEVLKNSQTLLNAKAELNQVIGKGKMIEEADIIRLPYLRSVLKESARLHPPVPFLLPRRVEEEVELCGYTIPKDSQVLVNAWAIGRDPQICQNPLSFQPERFLNSDIDVKGQDFELIPFGGGRRICPGLPLAMRMVPVMLGSLINCFDWELEDGIAPKELDVEEKFGCCLTFVFFFLFTNKRLCPRTR